MNLNELANYINQSGQHVLIEAEAKKNQMNHFIASHNASYGQGVTTDTDGVILLHDGADKWGVELRVYFEHITGMPTDFAKKAKENKVYKNQYTYRINDKEVVEGLFARGFRIGVN